MTDLDIEKKQLETLRRRSGANPHARVIDYVDGSPAALRYDELMAVQHGKCGCSKPAVYLTRDQTRLVCEDCLAASHESVG